MSADFRSGHRQCLREFIEIYKSEKCLWQAKTDEYRNSALKEDSYQKLVDKLREIDPMASKESVLKKINNIRSNFRKELKKVRLSTKLGEDPYVPKLWYFKHLKFLTNEVCTRRNTRMELQREENDVKGEIGFSADLMSPESPEEKDIQESNSSGYAAPFTRLAKQRVDTAIARKEDRFDIFGKNVAMKLRDLSKQQRIICEKLINDALYAAEMGSLTPSHTNEASTSTFNPNQPPYFTWQYDVNPSEANPKSGNASEESLE